MRRSAASLIAILAAAMFGASMAHADIAAFNTAIKAADFKKAASEAAATWPTLDKNRDDIEVIAREFGFAAYMAGDYSQARTFAEFAATHTPTGGAPTDDHAQSEVLFRLADHKAQPSAATRDLLFTALTARTAHPGMDNITFLAADAVIAYDFKTGNWDAARRSTDIATKLTSAGGWAYKLDNRRYELFTAIADFMNAKKPSTYDRFGALVKSIRTDVDDAPDDKTAERMAPLYWEASAWRQSVDSYFSSALRRHGLDGEGEYLTEAEKNAPPSARGSRILHLKPKDDPCQRKIKIQPKIKYPETAVYKGMVGTVILRVDVDDSGQLSNPVIVAAVPEPQFAKAVVESIPQTRVAPGEKWNASTCKLAEIGYTITYIFSLGF